MKTIKVKVTYIEELLGTASSDPDLFDTFIAENAPNDNNREEEIAAITDDTAENRPMTIFPKDDNGNPFTWDYQWKGFFKDSCGMLRRVTGTKSKNLKAYKKEIDGLIFVSPRKIPLVLPDGETIGSCQRPLRASTAQGERIALSCSETVPPGTTQEFEILLLKDDLESAVIEWLDYGKLHGTGQWRNSGKGRFEYELL